MLWMLHPFALAFAKNCALLWVVTALRICAVFVFMSLLDTL